MSAGFVEAVEQLRFVDEELSGVRRQLRECERSALENRIVDVERWERRRQGLCARVVEVERERRELQRVVAEGLEEPASDA